MKSADEKFKTVWETLPAQFIMRNQNGYNIKSCKTRSKSFVVIPESEKAIIF